MADSVKLQMTGSPDQARSLLEQTLQAEGFRFTWENGGKGILEKGSRTKAMLLGAFAIHYKYVVLLYPDQNGGTVIDLGLGATGLVGGAAGVVKIRRKLDQIGVVLTNALQSAGVLVASISPPQGTSGHPQKGR
ncbi:hypothetical protein [Actinomadura sp. 9N407]|uniref:hypothetical protein n=1 Tax=Actinomadura sp. 9N407 TaxID=3375154 RepID=UPI003796992D